MAVSLLKPPVSEVKPSPGPGSGLKNPLGLLEKALDIIVFQGGDDGRGYRNMCRIAGGYKPHLSP
jgi:hypothetical protein